MTYNFVPATDVPCSKVDVLVSDSFYIEACRRQTKKIRIRQGDSTIDAQNKT